jgi:tetratricopeptide (TPR) repeat protein
MNSNEFDRKIHYNIDGFLSVNTFFSATTNKDLAAFFVSGSINGGEDEVERILFQIDIDKTVNKFSYANISAKSAFGDDEGEMLFTMGAVFRITSMNKMDNGLWHVILKLTGEEDENLCKLTKYVKDDIIQSIPFISLAKLMGITARYKKAEQFYLLSLNDSVVSQDAGCIAAVHNDLGLNYKLMEQMDKAISCFQASLDLKLKYLRNADTNPSVAITYNNLGGIHFAQEEYELAAIMYRNAARIYRADPNSNQISLATCYNNIATICKELERYEDALLMYEKSLEVRLSVLPSTHPMIATAYNNIAQVYYIQGQSDRAAEYWKKAITIQQSSLPSNHPLLGRTYQSIAIILYENGHLEQALEYGKQSQKIKSANFSADHPKVKEENEWISKLEEELRLRQS